MLDSRIPPLDKLRVAQDVLDEVDGAKDEESCRTSPRRSRTARRARTPSLLVTALQDQLDRAVTDAFSTPFLLAALMALAALVPVALSRGEQL